MADEKQNNQEGNQEEHQSPKLNIEGNEEQGKKEGLTPDLLEVMKAYQKQNEELLERIRQLEQKSKGEGKTGPYAENMTEFVSHLAQAIQNNRPENRGTVMFARPPIPMSEIDNDDLLEEPANFFAWAFSTRIWDDVRGGMPVQTPYNRPIAFKHLYRNVRGAGRDAEVISVCMATVHSKKEANFIRSHSLFGIKYFESRSEVMNSDVELTNKIAGIFSTLTKRNDRDIIDHAMRLQRGGAKIVMTNDAQDLRKQIAHIEAMKEIERYSKRYGDVAKESFQFAQELQNSE